jgi:uncharacterized BrkB/YihY/UPF0761 family membrane protein
MRKKVLIFLIVIIIIFLIFTLLFWVSLKASSHNISKEVTNNYNFICGLISIVLIFLIFYIMKNFKKV